MILPSEIRKIAEHKGVPTSTIDKDWVMTWYEIICFPVASLKLNDGYSDSLILSDITLPSYMLSEISAEKLRATIQRSYPAPRDYFDLWFLSRRVDPDDWPAIADAFRRKSEYKHVAFSNHLDFFEPVRLRRSEKAWEHSLGKHVSTGQLPDFNRVIGDLKIKLQTVFG